MRVLLSIVVVTLFISVGESVAASDQHKSWVEPQIQMVFNFIPKGCFRMGNPEVGKVIQAVEFDEIGYSPLEYLDEQPEHEVCLDAFWMGRHEVTLGQWQQLMGQRQVGADKQLPMTGISWQEANIFAQEMTRRARKGRVYRLPSEAEWEYACRAGSPINIKAENKAGNKDGLKSVAWFSFNGARSRHPKPVEQLEPNGYGLYDMLGNVWEYVQDTYATAGYINHDLYNPVIRGDSPRRVIRGGSFRSVKREIRCTNRGYLDQAQSMGQIGFRLVMVVH